MRLRLGRRGAALRLSGSWAPGSDSLARPPRPGGRRRPLFDASDQAVTRTPSHESRPSQGTSIMPHSSLTRHGDSGPKVTACHWPSGCGLPVRAPRLGTASLIRGRRWHRGHVPGDRLRVRPGRLTRAKGGHGLLA